jgi:hypothetical protein
MSFFSVLQPRFLENNSNSDERFLRNYYSFNDMIFHFARIDSLVQFMGNFRMMRSINYQLNMYETIDSMIRIINNPKFQRERGYHQEDQSIGHHGLMFFSREGEEGFIPLPTFLFVTKFHKISTPYH